MCFFLLIVVGVEMVKKVVEFRDLLLDIVRFVENYY